jgi:hypothetical protein
VTTRTRTTSLDQGVGHDQGVTRAAPGDRRCPHGAIVMMGSSARGTDGAGDKDVSGKTVDRSESSGCVRSCRLLIDSLHRSVRSNSEMSDVDGKESTDEGASQQSKEASQHSSAQMCVDGPGSDLEKTTSCGGEGSQERIADSTAPLKRRRCPSSPTSETQISELRGAPSKQIKRQ